MATTKEYIDYVCEQISKKYIVRDRKMFGEYMVYINEKPILLVCNNIVYVKILDCLNNKMKDQEKGFPYVGSKEHYILRIDDYEFSNEVIDILEPITKVSVKKVKNKL